jgi:aspartyl-tRNA(Asn)/glutamyl-tRNA(Gln) amidotransferase subunit C
MPQHFSTADVEHIARLARLALSPDEAELFATQLAGFLSYAEQVQAVPTGGVPPTSHPLAAATPMRDDEVRRSLAPDETLAGAPDGDRVAGLFKVPRVLGG